MTSGFDLARALRRVRPQRLSRAVRRRPDRDLPLVGAPAAPGPPLMLDACVYIDVLQDASPPIVDELLRLRIIEHSSVCLAELTHLFGALDPSHPGTRRVLRELSAMLEAIPAHRLLAPSIRAAGEAGMLAGLFGRLTGRRSGPELLTDALLYLHAAEAGCVLLTRNIADFDAIDQILGTGRVLFYRRS